MSQEIEETFPTSMPLSLFRRVSNLADVSLADALLEMATECGPVRDLALFVATLPCHNETCKGADFMDHKILHPKKHTKWLPRFQANLWACYHLVVHVCYPSGRDVADSQLDRKTSKKQRPELAGTGMVTRKKVPTAKVARAAVAATLEACRPRFHASLGRHLGPPAWACTALAVPA